ncbi:MAG TPA: hypothetical protein H9694_08100 [Firmicutes bacterium]|nr:hypothetical protein [Bacillota bacterium]
MHISRFLKTVLYAALALVLTFVSTMLQLGFQSPDTLSGAYFQSDLYLFVAAAACLGTAVYSYRAYTSRHREHTSDSLFLLIVGIALMIAAVVTVVSFGGLGEEFTQTGYTAANVNILLMTALPLPFLIRAFVLAASCGRHEPSRRIPAVVVCGVATLALILSIALGGMMRLIHYSGSAEEGSAYDSYTSDGVYTQDEGGKSI